ncbi:MAG: hypothetical protein JXA67_07290 [Micromonosporaceae bacterium]|nr:hypothetical protein [Micromonosporaceae bacterium]
MRSQAEIAYMLEWFPAHTKLSAPFVRGAVAALRWALGQQAAPVTGRQATGPAEWAAVAREGDEAADAMYNGGRAAGGTFSAGYLQGVEHMATWITGGEGVGRPDGWPFPEEAPPAHA